MAVKPMTAQGQWVCFGPDRAFAYKIETGRVIQFESTPTGWNLTMEPEASPFDKAIRMIKELVETLKLFTFYRKGSFECEGRVR